MNEGKATKIKISNSALPLDIVVISNDSEYRDMLYDLPKPKIIIEFNNSDNEANK